MRKEYDFSEAKRNPYASQLKKQITIRLDEDAIDYFKSISQEVGIPYQSLINLSSVRLNVEQNQLVSGDRSIRVGSIGLQGA